MNTLIRWGKFNVVGAVGMVVQVGSLAVLNWLSAGHYLLASAAAPELPVTLNRYMQADSDELLAAQNMILDAIFGSETETVQ